MKEKILALAETLGEAEDGEGELLERLCRAAEQELLGRLRAGVAAEDCEPAFVTAAAWLALAGLYAVRAAGEAESFTAGELTVRPGDGGAQGELLRAQAERMMAPYVKDGGFSFLGVRG